MRLTQKDKDALSLALHVAIMSEEELIRCHRVGWRIDEDGQPHQDAVPDQFRAVVDRCVMHINGWKHLLNRLK